MKISKRAAALKPSGIRRFFELTEGRRDVIALTLGEPDFKTPYHIRDAAIVSLEKGFTRYTPNAGLSSLRKAVSKYLERRFGLSYDWSGEILTTVGGSEAIDLAIRAICDEGDEIIVPEPSFVCYSPIITLAGGVPAPLVTYEKDRFKITPEGLKSAITPNTRALILPYPTNPTGGVMTRDDLEKIVPIIREHDLTVVSDEVYAELTYGFTHTSIAALPRMKERVIYCGSMSKSHSMTGWRLGYVCAPKEVTSAMHKIHQYALMCAPGVSQYAAIEALERGDADCERMRDAYDERRRLIVTGLRRLGLPCFEPEGAFYAFPNVGVTGLSSSEFAERFLEGYNVAAVPGPAFGASGEGFLRMCYAADPELISEALTRLGKFLDTLK